MSADLAAKVAGSAAAGYRNLIGRAVKVGGPAGGMVGTCTDLGAPVANFSLYFTIGAGVLTAIAGWMWFGRRQKALRLALADGRITPEEMQKITETNGWSVSFAFGLVATLVLGLVFVAQLLIAKPDDGGPDRGVLATLVPQIQKMQDSLFNIQRDVSEIKDTAAKTKEQTERIESKTDTVIDMQKDVGSKIDELRKAFEEASTKDGLITNPQTPVDHYKNARYSELKSDFGAARKSYTAYIASGADFIDPAMAWVDMLKVQDGIDGAREVVTTMQKNNTTLSLQAVAATLLPAAARKGSLQKLGEAAPEFAPVFYLISREYSVEKLGEQTISDKTVEKGALEKFRALNEKGRFQKYFLDKKEAKKWLDDAEARWAKIASTPDTVLKNPVTLTPQRSNQGWGLTLGFADYKIKKVEYRLDGQGDFKDNGTIGAVNPQTGLPMPNPHIDAGTLSEGAHKLEVRYVDMADKLNGPYTLTFNTNAAALANSKQLLGQFSSSWLYWGENSGKTLLYFTSILTHRHAIKTIRYSLDSDALDKTFEFEAVKPGDEPNTVGETIYVEIPGATKSATVEIEFTDGTKSEKKTFMRR